MNLPDKDMARALVDAGYMPLKEYVMLFGDQPKPRIEAKIIPFPKKKTQARKLRCPYCRRPFPTYLYQRHVDKCESLR